MFLLVFVHRHRHMKARGQLSGSSFIALLQAITFTVQRTVSSRDPLVSPTLGLQVCIALRRVLGIQAQVLTQACQARFLLSCLPRPGPESIYLSSSSALVTCGDAWSSSNKELIKSSMTYGNAE